MKPVFIQTPSQIMRVNPYPGRVLEVGLLMVQTMDSTSLYGIQYVLIDCDTESLRAKAYLTPVSWFWNSTDENGIVFAREWARYPLVQKVQV